nr:MAG TPA: hypothetical protein [Caudoviricetes sp.]
MKNVKNIWIDHDKYIILCVSHIYFLTLSKL